MIGMIETIVGLLFQWFGVASVTQKVSNSSRHDKICVVLGELKETTNLIFTKKSHI